MSSRLALAMSASALVVALLGSTPLGHALVSNVPRNSVGPLQLKRNAVGPQKVAPNAIRASHVLNGSLLAVDFKPGQLPAGPKGEKGEKGDRGDAGPPGLSEREVLSQQSPTSSDMTRVVVLNCPSGKVSVGGGGAILGGDVPVALTQSNSGFQGIATRWQVAAREITPTGANWALTGFVVCAKVG